MSKKDKPYLKDGELSIQQFNTDIEIKNVNFEYITNHSVLKDLSVCIKKNNLTAIVGATGAGKSTLISLLLRFYDPISGDILIDGVKLTDIKHKEWLNIAVYVPQDVFLFNMTVAENIKIGKEKATMAEVIDAAKTSNAHDFITRLPQGYDTYIGERGIKLSGGQKQMIALARALISNPKILILDEATSSLDNESERLIQNAINKISREMTIIAIAHRLSTIVSADKILVMDKGEIKEQGTHEELLNIDGLYKKYYDLQLY